jgi:ribosomal protein S18 acetylase RimI-like enzyme
MGEIAGYTDFYHHDQDVYINHNTNFLPGRADDITPTLFYQMGLERARKVLPPGGRARTISVREETNLMLESLSFHPIQVQYRMHIDFHQPPEPPSWPMGYQVTAFDRQTHAREVYEVIETAFQELPHREGNSYEGWVHFILERSDFNPSLLFMVTIGEEIAGVAVGFDNPISGWIRQLAVKKSHRGTQIALNLLRHAFVAFHRRGRTSVGLTVDSENMTGAPQLYLRAGMRQTEKYVTYVREI